VKEEIYKKERERGFVKKEGQNQLRKKAEETDVWRGKEEKVKVREMLHVKERGLLTYHVGFQSANEPSNDG
jgi:hypothetical protein